jgi:hypothetical protein
MDLASLGQVFFIWMLFFITLGNCAISKSKVPNVLSNLDGNIIGFNVFSMFLVSVNRRRHPLHFFVERTYTIHILGSCGNQCVAYLK